MIPRKLVERTIGLLPFLLIPVVAAPVVTAAVLLLRGQEYQAHSAVWVYEDSLVRMPLGVQDEQSSPAQQQARAVEELLLTEQFAREVAVAAGVLQAREPGTAVPAKERVAELKALEKLRERISVNGGGANLLSFTTEGKDAESAFRLNAAVLDTYMGRLVGEASRRSEIAVAHYTDQLQMAEAEYQKRQQALASYITANPNAILPGVIDSQYSVLVTAVRDQSQRIDEIRTALDGAQLTYNSWVDRDNSALQIADAPAVPPAAESVGAKQFVAYTGAAFLGTAFLAVAYAYATYRSDHTIRSGEDVAAAGVPVLGYIPEIGAGRMPLVRRVDRRGRHFARGIAVHLATVRGHGSRSA